MKKLFVLWRAQIFLLASGMFALGEAYCATTRTWTGNAAGANSLWLNSTNWSNTNAPVAGDALVFPTNVTKLQVTNDFAANTDFDSFTLSNSYILRGNALDLSNGVKVAAVGSAPVIHINLRLLAVALAACPFDVDAQAQLSITNLNLNGRAASMRGDGDIAINGVVSGTGAASALNKAGAGTLRLNRANTYAGTTTVSNGTLVVNGVISNLTLFTSTTLAGTGTVGSVSVSGATTIAPGDPGIGILRVTGPLTLNSGTTLQLTMNDTIPGITLDQLHCSSNINLGSANLSITKAPGFTPAPNTTFVILSNATPNAITGTFAGLPDTAITNIGGVDFQISYVGGNGNDVTLRALSAPLSWDGGAIANTNWSNITNWSGNISPQPEGILFFPPNVPGRTNYNDFTNGFPVDTIVIGQSNYVILGTNELVLTGRLIATNNVGTVDFFPPMQPPAVISNAAGGTLILHGQLTGGMGFHSGGTIVMNGSINGNFNKYGAGILVLVNSNNLASPQIYGGTVQVLNDRALHPISSQVAVFPSTRLELLNGRALSNSILLRGTLFGGGNGTSNHVAGPISVDAAILEVASNSWLTLAGTLSGTNFLTKVGPGTLELSATNSYSRATLIDQGTLLLSGIANRYRSQNRCQCPARGRRLDWFSHQPSGRHPHRRSHECAGPPDRDEWRDVDRGQHGTFPNRWERGRQRLFANHRQ